MKRLVFVFSVFFLIISTTVFAADDYPNIDISGYKKWQYKDLRIEPLKNIFLGSSKIGYSSSLSGLTWQEQLKLRIDARLSEKLIASYDIEQQPDFPERFKVEVDYDKKQNLLFGDFTAKFSGNEFTTTTKTLNGVRIKTEGNNYKFKIIPSGKLRSNFQALTRQNGNNSRGPYRLGHGIIVEGSESVWKNDQLLERRKDYNINYFEGEVTFSEIVRTVDEIKYTYEYSSFADFFFPTLSRRNFFGARGEYSFNPNPLTQAEETVAYQTEVTGEVFPNETYILDDPDRPGLHYRAAYFPIVPYSEELFHFGRTLKKDADYKINYLSGLINFITIDRPTVDDPVYITYKRYQASSESEVIYGSASRDYFFKKAGVIENSERIMLDGKILLSGTDYQVDYERGKILFNYSVASTSVINAAYLYKIKKVNKQAENGKSLATIGVTYLQEKSKQGDAYATTDAQETQSGATIIENNKRILIPYPKFPLVATAEGGRWEVTKNNDLMEYGEDYVVPSVEAGATGSVVTPLTELQYINDKNDLSDGYYTGTIKVLTTVEATDSFTVLYTYYNAVPGKYPGWGQGDAGPYPIKNYKDIVPGSARVKVDDGTGNPKEYFANSGLDDSYKHRSDGFSFDYTSNNPSITFNEPLSKDHKFTVTFLRRPTSNKQGGDFSQDVLGVDLDISFGKLLNIRSELARSYIDKFDNNIATSESFTGDQVSSSTRRLPALGNLPIVDSSEKIQLNGNTINKDNYVIDNATGIIVLTGVNVDELNSNDSIAVFYDYKLDTSNDIDGLAHKYKLTSELGFFDFSYTKKDVETNFSPIGGIRLGQGSNSQNFTAGFDPKFQGIKLDYEYTETNDPLNRGSSIFTRNYDRIYGLSLNPGKAAQINFNIRKYHSLADNNSINTLLDEYSGDLTPAEIKKGRLLFKQEYKFKKTKQDKKIGLEKTDSYYYKIHEGLDINKRVNCYYEYESDEPETLSDYGTTQEALSKKEYNRTQTYYTKLDLTGLVLKKFYKLDGYAKYIRTDNEKIMPTTTKREVLNTTYKFNVSPFKIVSSKFNLTRIETPSILVSGKNPLDEAASCSLSVDPSTRLNGSIAHTNRSGIDDFGRESGSRTNTYVFNIIPIQSKYVVFSNGLNLFYQNAGDKRGTTEVDTEEQRFTQEFSLTFKPLNTLTLIPAFKNTNYWRLKTNEAFLKTSAQTSKCTMKIGISDYSLTGDYSNKVTTRLVNYTVRHKAAVGLRLSKKIFKWGTVVVSHDYEHNRGEVLPVGSFPDTDYQKKTNQISINYEIPQENPVLSSMLFIATLKEVDYVNNLNTSDNLKANMVTFEGTLNF
ncbi:hypothetical protein ACFL52_04055 [Candidatus Margulisiibacteriota bacterium]